MPELGNLSAVIIAALYTYSIQRSSLLFVMLNDECHCATELATAAKQPFGTFSKADFVFVFVCKFRKFN